MRVLDRVIEPVMEEFHIAGATLGVARAGRLVHAKGYGFADVEAGRHVTPRTFFSLASVTKPVTGVAVLKLVEEGRLGLDDKIMEILRDTGPPPRKSVADPRFYRITVRHLLLYAGGWGRGENYEKQAEQFGEYEESDDGKITEAWRIALTRPLDFDPGSTHHYSNFGFLILRLVLETVTGQAYEPFVKRHVLAPMGIKRMMIEPPDYLPEETRRYQAGGVQPARRNPGNWLSTPAEMTRFLSALDGSRGRPFLNRRIVAEMLAPPPPPIKVNRNGSHVGLGWDVVRPMTGGLAFGKNGGKPGVMAWIEHLPGPIDWAVMFNTSKPKEARQSPAGVVRRRLLEALAEIKAWPEHDLFEIIA
jgi:N-acyl-D-amino-acid deacylase